MWIDHKITAGLTRLPLVARRTALRSIWHARHFAGRAPSFGVDPILKFAIRVSSAEAVRLDAEIGFHNMLTSLEWLTALKRSRAALIRDMESIEIDKADVLRHVARTRDPLIIAPLHMGCFALPLAKLMHAHFAGRPMLILRAREDRPDETAAMERLSEIGTDMRFLNVARKQNFLEAIRFARDGAVIVNFVDLPASYGSPAAVTLFGKPARLAMGLPALARLTNACVVPLCVHSTLGGDIVKLGRPFESYAGGEAEKARVAEIVRHHIEQAALGAPEQWHMWPRLQEYYETDVAHEAA